METTVTLFDNRTLQKSFLQDGIKTVLNKRKLPFRLENEKDGRVFFSDVQDYIIKHDSHNLYTTYANIMAAFKKYGVNNGVDLILAMFDHKDQLNAQGYNMSKIKDPMELIKKYNIVGHHSYIDMDTTRTLVVRSKYGNYPVNRNFIGVFYNGRSDDGKKATNYYCFTSNGNSYIFYSGRNIYVF